MKKLRITTAVVATMALAMSGMSAGATSAPTVRRKAQSSSNLSRGIERPAPKPDALSSARSRGKLSRAEYALERATSLFRLSNVRERYGDVERPDAHDATLLMRDLALSKHNLSGSDRRRANRILARPTDGNSDPQGDGYQPGALQGVACTDADGDPGDDVCLTYVTNTSDAVPLADSPYNGFPDYIDDALTTITTVWQKEVNDLGYNAPQLDGNSVNNGGNAKLDIYFADIGDDGLYGYCTTDEPGAGNKKTVSAYCVLDNDYSQVQYDAPPPEVYGLEALQVTMAHEFFHAVQFNYDWKEAKFLMEGTAVWIEDEVFDSVNASFAYLPDSGLHQPEIPLDAFQKGDDDENFEYGAWIYFRFLSEALMDPGIIRDIWDAAGANKKGIEAVPPALSAVSNLGPSTQFRDAFAFWGAYNYFYDAYYDEGYDGSCSPVDPLAYADVLGCARPPADASYFFGDEDEKTSWRRLPMDHLSNRFVSYIPTAYSDTESKLRIHVDLPKEARGGEATVVLQDLSFLAQAFRINLNADGDGKRTVNFHGTANEVVLVLSNTGKFNNETYKYKAELI